MPVFNADVPIGIVVMMTGEYWYVCEDRSFKDKAGLIISDIRRTDHKFKGSRQPYTKLQDTDYFVNKSYAYFAEHNYERLYTTEKFEIVDRDDTKVTVVIETENGKRYNIVGYSDWEAQGNYYCYIIENRKTA